MKIPHKIYFLMLFPVSAFAQLQEKPAVASDLE